MKGADGMRSRVLVPCVLAVLLQACSTSAASIGIFSTADCSSCNLSIERGATDTLYVRALTEGVTVGDMSGAEFRIEGLPAGWSVTVIPNPLVVVTIGDPFGDGIDLAFAVDPHGTCVDLFKVVIRAWSSEIVHDGVLRVVVHRHPAYPWSTCPGFFIDCGQPCDYFDLYCTGGGSLFINSSRSCTVAVRPSAWSDVKRLYGD
jgi:hypothetical protein